MDAPGSITRTLMHYVRTLWKPGLFQTLQGTQAAQHTQRLDSAQPATLGSWSFTLLPNVRPGTWSRMRNSPSQPRRKALPRKCPTLCLTSFQKVPRLLRPQLSVSQAQALSGVLEGSRAGGEAVPGPALSRRPSWDWRQRTGLLTRFPRPGLSESRLTRDPLTEEPQAQCCPHRRRVRPRPLQSPCTGPAPTLLFPNPRALGELPKHPGTRPRATDAGCADRPRSCWFSVAPGQRRTCSEPCARSSGTGPSQLSWDTAGSPTGSSEGPPTPRAALLQQEPTLSPL